VERVNERSIKEWSGVEERSIEKRRGGKGRIVKRKGK